MAAPCMHARQGLCHTHLAPVLEHVTHDACIMTAVRQEQPGKAPPTPAITESRPAQPTQQPAAETVTQSPAQPVTASQQVAS